MAPAISKYLRLLPSWLDILAIAQLNRWHQINLDLEPILSIQRGCSIVLQAEDGELSGLPAPEGSTMMNFGSYVATTNEARPLLVETSGTARYRFTAPVAGDYLVTAMVRAMDGSSNSLWIDIDQDPVAPHTTWHITQYTTGFESRTASWQGTGTFDNPAIVPKAWRLDKGSHQLRLVARERLCEIDYLILTLATGQPYSTLSWSAHCSDYRLQSAPALLGPWTLSSMEIAQTSGRLTAQTAASGNKSFYRLVRPPTPQLRLASPSKLPESPDIFFCGSCQ
jgi:hypothetical protein